VNARFLLTLFDAIYLIAMTAWVGSLLFVTFAVAPTIARVLSPRYYAWGATAGALALAALVCGALSVPEYRGTAIAVQSLLLLAGTLAMLHGGNVLVPALDAAHDAGPAGQARVRRLRRQGAWLDGLVLAGGLGLLVAFAARPAPRTAGIVEPTPQEAAARRLEQNLKGFSRTEAARARPGSPPSTPSGRPAP
jgi:hypothetical protein